MTEPAPADETEALEMPARAMADLWERQMIATIPKGMDTQDSLKAFAYMIRHTAQEGESTGQFITRITRMEHDSRQGFEKNVAYPIMLDGIADNMPLLKPFILAARAESRRTEAHPHHGPDHGSAQEHQGNGADQGFRARFPERDILARGDFGPGQES